MEYRSSLEKEELMAECPSAERALASYTLVAETQQSYWVSDRFYQISKKKITLHQTKLFQRLTILYDPSISLRRSLGRLETRLP